MTSEELNRIFIALRVPIGVEALQDLVHVFAPRSELLDYASWGITVTVLALLGWIAAVRTHMRPLACGVAGLALFIASFAFSNAVELIARPQANPFLGFAAALFVAFLVSPLAMAVAMMGAGLARICGKVRPLPPPAP
jgi:hypothetical protein